MFRRSGYFFVAALGPTVLAFWPHYLGLLPGTFSTYTHLHAGLMVAWYGLLIAQPFLIFSGRKKLHRLLGRVSHVLAPAAVVVMVLLTHAGLQHVPEADFAGAAVGAYLPLSMMCLFGAAYVLGIVYRKSQPLHSRYMLCTFLGLVDPVVARLVYFYLPHLDIPLYEQWTSYLLTVLALVILMVRERRQRVGRSAFPVMLGLSTVVYGLWFTWAQTDSWVAVARWFRDLPLT